MRGRTTQPQPISPLDRSAHIFRCNTDRGGRRGVLNEELMHARCFVATWIPFQYPGHVERVKAGDLIAMYANRIGVVGLGLARGGVEKLGADAADRIWPFVSDDVNREEWRVPVEWLAWDETRPCDAGKALRPSFVDITQHAERVDAIRRHYGVPRGHPTAGGRKR